MNNKRTHKRSSIRNSFVLIASLLSILPMLVLVFYAIHVFSSSSKEYMADQMDGYLQSLNSNIQTVLGDVKDMANVVASSKYIQQGMEESTLTNWDLMETVSNVIINKDYISTILIFDRQRLYYSNRTTFLSSHYGQTNYYVTYDRSILDRLYAAYGDKSPSSISSFWMDGDSFHLSSNNLLLYRRAIVSLNNMEYLGELIIGIDKAVFERFIAQPGNNYTVLIWEEGHLLYQSDQAFLSEEEEKSNFLSLLNAQPQGGKIRHGGEDFIVRFVTDPVTGWQVACLLRYSLQQQSTHRLIGTTLLIVLLCILLATLAAYIATNRITGQIALLSRTVENFKNQHYQPAEFDTNDEVGLIGDEFQTVVLENMELQKNIYQISLKQREAQLIALQSQINPHFLFNTLDSIFWMAQKLGAKEISKMVTNLSKIFRITLNRGEMYITVSEQLIQLRCYLEIQQIRYPDKFTFSFKIDEEILPDTIVNLILQPVVENAVYHGLEPKEGPGWIAVSGRAEGDELFFVIEDNGVGFDFGSQANEKGGYALQNIRERIRMRYGEQYGIEIDSHPGSGTRVTIHLRRLGVNLLTPRKGAS